MKVSRFISKSIIYSWYYMRMIFSLKSVHKIKGIKFYLPKCPVDYIQRTIYETKNFFNIRTLNSLDEYIPDGATILDIGANIGNHSLYWSERAKKIIAFECVKNTYENLSKNIEINNLQNKIEAINIGLSDVDSMAEIENYNSRNTGGARIQKSENGSVKIKRLDSLDLKIDTIDFVKIDVEGHEDGVLRGMVECLEKYKPILFIEIVEENFVKVDALLKSLGYEISKKITFRDYIYKAIK